MTAKPRIAIVIGSTRPGRYADKAAGWMLKQAQAMAMSDIENVLSVFRGIGNRDTNLATKHMHPTKYTQHNPHASDGIGRLRVYSCQGFA
jgi:NAD(P)H-dependent FMN reductase